MHDLTWDVEQKPRRRWRDGVPCKHPGCLHHVTHPCEGCGRIAGRWPVDIDLPAWDALSDEALKATEAA